MKPFAWILISFPVYLLVHGKLAGYLSLTKSTVQATK